MPFISATYLVEIAALVVPSWRPLRHGGPEGRRKLGRAAVILALGLAVFQGYGVARVLSGMPDLGSPSFPIVIVTLIAAVGITHLLCETVTRYGLASGYGALFAAIPFLAIFAPLEDHTAELAARDVLTLLAAIAAIAAVTWYMLERGAPKLSPLQKTASYRNAATPQETPPLWLPAPSSGLAPSNFVPSLLMIPVTLGATWPGLRGLGIVLENATVYRTIGLCLVAGAAVLFTHLFNQPGRVAEVFARARGANASRAALAAEASALLRPAAMRAVVFLLRSRPSSSSRSGSRPSRSPCRRRRSSSRSCSISSPSFAPAEARRISSPYGPSTAPTRLPPRARRCTRREFSCLREGSACGDCSSSSGRTCRSI